METETESSSSPLCISRCIVCHIKFKCPSPSQLETEANQNLSPSESEIDKEFLWKRFNYIFHLYNYIEIDDDDLIDTTTSFKNCLPLCFCPSCKPTIIKLANLHKQLELIQEEYRKTVANVSLRIVTSSDISDNLGNSENKNIDEMTVGNEENSENGPKTPIVETNCCEQEEQQQEKEDPQLIKTTEYLRRLIYHHYSPTVILKQVQLQSQRRRATQQSSKKNKNKNKDKQKYNYKMKNSSSSSSSKSKSKSKSKSRLKTKHKVSTFLKTIKTEVESKDFENYNNCEWIENENDNDNQNELNSVPLVDNFYNNNDDDDFASYFPPDDDDEQIETKREKRSKRRRKPVKKTIPVIPFKLEKSVIPEAQQILQCSEDESEVEEVEEDSDFDPEKEVKAIKENRKFIAQENKQDKMSKRKRRIGRDPDYIPFQQLVLPWVEITPGQFMYGEKYPYERLDEGDFFCKVGGDCTYSCKVQTDMFAHMNNMHNEARHPCHVCQRSYARKKWLEDHVCQPKKRQRVMYKMEEKEDGTWLYNSTWTFRQLGELWECLTCGALKSQRSIMGTHIREHHLEPDRYKCEFCETAFGNKKSYTCHMEQHTESRDYLCELCSASFKSLRNLKVHSRFHSNIIYQCNVCSKKFLYKEGLGRHRRQTGHLTEKLLAAAAAAAASATSTSGSLDGASISADTVSMKEQNQNPSEPNSSGAQDNSNSNREITDLAKLNFKCPRCSAPHETAHSFNLHLRFCKQPKEYLCDHCSKSFNVKASLLIHIERFHTEHPQKDGEVQFEPWKNKQRRRLGNWPVGKRSRRSHIQLQNANDPIIQPPLPPSQPLPTSLHLQEQHQQQQQQQQQQLSANESNLQHIPGFPLSMNIPMPNFFSQLQLHNPDHNFN